MGKGKSFDFHYLFVCVCVWEEGRVIRYKDFGLDMKDFLKG